MANEYQSCLATLGLADGASQAEIKKAYFRLVRVYPPEKEPELFQKIRHAYEVLKDAPQPEENPKQQDFPPPEDVIIQSVVRLAVISANAGKYKDALQFMGNALSMSPSNPYLLLYMARLQRLAGKPRKAAKTAQQLAEVAPDCAEAHVIAAEGFFDSGWYKKALPEFEKAYSLGIRDYEFLLDYASAAVSNGQIAKARQIQLEILRTTKWDKENIGEAFYVYCCLAEQCPPEEEAILTLLQDYETFIQKHKRLIKEPDEEYYLPATLVWSEQDSVLGFHSVYEIVDSLLETWSRLHKGFATEMEDSRKVALATALHFDTEIQGELWGDFFAALCIPEPDNDLRKDKYALLDDELIIMKRKEKSREEAEIIHRKYPYFFEKAGAEVEHILAESTGTLFEKKKQEFAKLSNSYTGGDFYKLYPQNHPL